MALVLLALNNDEYSQTIKKALSPIHQVLTQDQTKPSGRLIDIIIFELEQGNIVDWKGENQIWVRYLLLITPEQLCHMPTAVQEHIDDIIIVPINPLEVQIRIRNLLRMRDHSEQQRRIYEQLATTNKALESTSDAIIIADNDGVAAYINPAFASLFGYNVSQLNTGGIPSVLFHSPVVGESVFNAVYKDGSWRGEALLKTKNRDTLPFLLNVDNIRDDRGELIGIIAICTDITQQKLLHSVQQEQRILAEAQLDTLQALTSTLDPTEVFERILQNISQVVPNDAANIILIQDGKIKLVDRDDYVDQPQIARLKSGEDPVHHYDDLQWMIDTDAPLVISRTKQYLNKHDKMQIHTPWLNSHIGIPIHLQEEIIGFLNVDSIQPGLFNQKHAQRLLLFAEQAAIAIHNSRLHEQAQKLAMIEERQRLARNLHDAVSQTLFSANIIAEALTQLWESRPQEVLPHLEQIRILNRGALAEMRSLLMELHPERLQQTPIEELLNQLTNGMLAQTPLDVTLIVTENLDVPPDVHEAIYYIAQEALNNIVRHAEANHASVQLQKTPTQINLTISDDGCGFNPDDVNSTSLGLDNIQERAVATKAHLSISSKIGEGTSISLHWLI